MQRKHLIRATVAAGCVLVTYAIAIAGTSSETITRPTRNTASTDRAAEHPDPLAEQQVVLVAKRTAPSPAPSSRALVAAVQPQTNNPFSAGQLHVPAGQPRAQPTTPEAEHRAQLDTSDPQLTARQRVLEESWASQTYDPQWTDAAREYVNTALTDAKVPTSRVQNLECRDTLCRMTMRFPSDEEAGRLYELRQPDHETSFFGSAGEYTVFIAREGERLPTPTDRAQASNPGSGEETGYEEEAEDEHERRPSLSELQQRVNDRYLKHHEEP